MKATEQDSTGYCLLRCKGDSNNWACGWNPKVWLFNWKLKSNSFLVVMSIMMSKGSIFAPVIESLSVTENVVYLRW